MVWCVFFKGDWIGLFDVCDDVWMCIGCVCVMGIDC